jgi:hypothetical protein
MNRQDQIKQVQAAISMLQEVEETALTELTDARCWREREYYVFTQGATKVQAMMQELALYATDLRNLCTTPISRLPLKLAYVGQSFTVGAWKKVSSGWMKPGCGAS